MPAKKSKSGIKAKTERVIQQMVLSGPQINKIIRTSIKTSADAFLKTQKTAKDTNNIEEASGSDDGLMLSPTDLRGDATANEQYAIEPPDAYTRIFAVRYLPIAWRITHGVAIDCFKSSEDFPFSFVYAQQHDIEKTNWSDDALSVMRDINYLTSAKQCMGNGRMDGEGFVLLIEEGFDWQNTDTSQERDPKKKIIQTLCVPAYYINYGVSVKIEDWNLDGTPRLYMVNLGATLSQGRQAGKSMKWHFSRILHHCPNPIDTDPKGLCVLDRNWQATVIGFNIDLACGEFSFRWGMGHPVFETPFTDQKDLERFMSKLGNPTRRTWHALLKDMKLTFAGPNGSPAGMDTIKDKCCYDEVVVGTGIPKPILKGEVAGVQTGSEVNERTYWSVLMAEQNSMNMMHWRMLAILNETGQIEVPDLGISWEYNTLQIPRGLNCKWSVHYVETENEKVKILNEKLDAINKMKDISTINEMRAMTRDLLNWDEKDYPDLDEDIGDQILSIYQSGSMQPNEPEPEEPESEEPESEEPEKGKKKETPKSPESKPEEKEVPERAGKSDIGPMVGCPDHANYNKSCPMCMFILQQKDQMASIMLEKGHTPKRISEYLHLDYNRVVKLRNDNTERKS